MEFENSEIVPELSYINLYLTWQCNFRCIHCWVEGDTVKKSIVNVDKIKRFIGEAKSQGLSMVRITGGEPLICKNEVMEIIEYCNSLDIRNEIETNAYLIDNTLIQFFQKYNVSLGVSLNGYDSKTNDTFTLKEGAFEKVLSNIKKCLKANVNVSLVTCVGKYNLSYFEKTLDFLSDIGVKNIKINTVTSCGRATEMMEKNLLFDDDDLLNFYQLYKRIRYKYKSKNVKIFTMIPQSLDNLTEIAKGEVYVCGGKHLLSYLPNNKVALCGYGGINEDIVLCDYNDETTVEDIWTKNEKLLYLRKYFDQLSGICAKCIHGKQCNSLCKIAGLLEYKKWDAPYPFCEKLYINNKFPASRMHQ